MIHRVKEKIGGKMNKLEISSLFILPPIFSFTVLPKTRDTCLRKVCAVLRNQGAELILSGKVHVCSTPVGRVWKVSSSMHSQS